MANCTPSPNGPRLQAQPQPVRTRTTIQHVFVIEVEDQGDGNRQLNVHSPGGEVLALPLTADMARQLGEALLAPKVEVPRNGAMALG